MWVKGSMGRVVPAGACSYVCRLGGCRVAGSMGMPRMRRSLYITVLE